LRAVAVLLVVVFHAGLPLPGGAFGVDVFFVISGFVITGVLASEFSATGRLSLPGFYARRIKRLLPALALMVTCVAVLGTLASPVGAQRTGAVTGVVASVFGANVYLANLGAGYFDVSATLNPLLHTWTLAVEEQFYLVFPALLLLSWWVGKRLSARFRVLVPVVAVATLSVLSLLWVRTTLEGATVFGLAGSRFAFYASPARAWEFGAGALLALLLPLVRKLPDVLGSALGALGVGLLALGIAPTAVGDPGLRLSAALLVVGGTSALIAAGSAANLFSRGLALAPFVWIGDLSYSWYLWHWPLIVFARAVWPVGGWVPVAAAAVSIVPAWLSLRLVENPIRRAPELRGRRLAALTAVCIAIPVAACAGLVAVNGAVERSAALESWQRVERPHADGVLGCNVPAPLGERPKGLCTWHEPHARGTVVLVGDSNAGHFTEPVVRAAKQAGYDVTVATLWSCPFVDLRVEPGEGDFHKACRHFFSGTLTTLERTHPSLVIMASRSDYYVEGEEVGLGAPASESGAPRRRGQGCALGARHALGAGQARPCRRAGSAGAPGSRAPDRLGRLGGDPDPAALQPGDGVT
jgi:peptidoglycan/LPS O-acetylase OafA/YrhL